jgi:diacylglycerol kinase family enzyme
VIGPEAQQPPLRWRGPDHHEHRSGAAILVSNNQYRLGRAVGSGTRPRIDDGLLGVTVVSACRAQPGGSIRPKRPWREWAVPSFEVDSDSEVAAGIDGEAATLRPPLRFEIVPQALRVRIARAHPGASPSAGVPDGARDTVRALTLIAAGHAPAAPALDGARDH